MLVIRLTNEILAMTKLLRVNAKALSPQDVLTKGLAIYTFDQAEYELKSLLSPIKQPAKAIESAVDRGAYMDFMDWLIPQLPADGGSDTYLKLLASSRDSDLSMLAGRIELALQGVAESRLAVDEYGSATGLLLPEHFGQRFERLIGYAAIALAWVREIDLTKL